MSVVAGPPNCVLRTRDAEASNGHPQRRDPVLKYSDPPGKSIVFVAWAAHRYSKHWAGASDVVVAGDADEPVGTGRTRR